MKRNIEDLWRGRDSVEVFLISSVVMIPDDVLHPRTYLLGDNLAMLDAKGMRDPLVVDKHARFPGIDGRNARGGGYRREGGSGFGLGIDVATCGNEVVACLLGDPSVALAPEEDEVGVDGVVTVGAGFGGGAPDFFAPFVVGDHVEFVFSKVQDSFDARGAFDEGCCGSSGVFGETHDCSDEVVEHVCWNEVGESFDESICYLGRSRYS